MDTDPPDHGGCQVPIILPTMEVDGINKKKKRPLADSDQSQPKKSANSTLSTPSIQLTFVSPDFSNEKKQYGLNDVAPYVVHVSRPESDPNSGFALRPIKFGHFLVKNNVKNVVMDGIKRIGRNRIAVEFKSALYANSFLDLPALSAAGYTATIPFYSVSRMGLIRNVPVEWSMEELVANLELPAGYGKVVRARRLSRKSINESNTPAWIPTQSVVLTFTGQKLPPRVYCFFTSLPVETYLLPTIQCNRCCRFGHVKAQCRSHPRCFKCSGMHEGESCDKEIPSCLYCSGPHQANDTSCPENSRQKSIKLIMSQESISYLEASARFPHVRRSFADSTRNSPSTTLTPIIKQSAAPNQISYRKTVFSPRPTIIPESPGYDRQADQAIIKNPSSDIPNGCAYPSSAFTPNDNILEQLTSILINIISRFSDTGLPNNILQNLTQLTTLLTQNASQNNPVELP